MEHWEQQGAAAPRGVQVPMEHWELFRLERSSRGPQRVQGRFCVWNDELQCWIRWGRSRGLAREEGAVLAAGPLALEERAPSLASSSGLDFPSLSNSSSAAETSEGTSPSGDLVWQPLRHLMYLKQQQQGSLRGVVAGTPAAQRPLPSSEAPLLEGRSPSVTLRSSPWMFTQELEEGSWGSPMKKPPGLAESAPPRPGWKQDRLGRPPSAGAASQREDVRESPLAAAGSLAAVRPLSFQLPSASIRPSLAEAARLEASHVQEAGPGDSGAAEHGAAQDARGVIMERPGNAAPPTVIIPERKGGGIVPPLQGPLQSPEVLTQEVAGVSLSPSPTQPYAVLGQQQHQQQRHHLHQHHQPQLQQQAPASSYPPLPARSGSASTLAPSPRTPSPRDFRVPPQPRPRSERGWDFINLCGEGAAGEVWKAENLDSGEAFAVKKVRKSLDPAKTNELAQEVDLLRQLSHPHIVSYIGYEVDEEFVYIFMEFLDESVSSRLKKYRQRPSSNNTAGGLGSHGVPGVAGASNTTSSSRNNSSNNSSLPGFPEPLLSKYTGQLLDGLGYLHSQGIMHRDIKGANILLDARRGIVKLADFGVAKKLESMRPMDNTALKGTMLFMAPEVIEPKEGQGYSGEKADIWSLGCTVIEMATGMLPWIDPINHSAPWGDPKNQYNTMRYIATSRSMPPFPPGASPLLCAFLAKCFTIPELRPSASELLRTDPFVALAMAMDHQHNAGLSPPRSVLPVMLPQSSSQVGGGAARHGHSTPNTGGGVAAEGLEASPSWSGATTLGDTSTDLRVLFSSPRTAQTGLLSAQSPSAPASEAVPIQPQDLQSRHMLPPTTRPSYLNSATSVPFMAGGLAVQDNSATRVPLEAGRLAPLGDGAANQVTGGISLLSLMPLSAQQPQETPVLEASGVSRSPRFASTARELQSSPVLDRYQQQEGWQQHQAPQRLQHLHQGQSLLLGRPEMETSAALSLQPMGRERQKESPQPVDALLDSQGRLRRKSPPPASTLASQGRSTSLQAPDLPAGMAAGVQASVGGPELHPGPWATASLHTQTRSPRAGTSSAVSLLAPQDMNVPLALTNTRRSSSGGREEGMGSGSSSPSHLDELATRAVPGVPSQVAPVRRRSPLNRNSSEQSVRDRDKSHAAWAPGLKMHTSQSEASSFSVQEAGGALETEIAMQSTRRSPQPGSALPPPRHIPRLWLQAAVGAVDLGRSQSLVDGPPPSTSSGDRLVPRKSPGELRLHASQLQRTSSEGAALGGPASGPKDPRSASPPVGTMLNSRMLMRRSSFRSSRSPSPVAHLQRVHESSTAETLSVAEPGEVQFERSVSGSTPLMHKDTVKVAGAPCEEPV